MTKKIDLSLLKGAIFSEDRKYRYVLWRIWNSRPLLLSIGLNPSIASELTDDPTITREISRAAREGFGGLLKSNLYAYVSINPDILLRYDIDSVGSENDSYLKYMIEMAGRTVCTWGSFPAAKKRAKVVLGMIPEPYCFGVNRDGQPKHPLYLNYSVPMVRYETENAKTE